MVDMAEVVRDNLTALMRHRGIPSQNQLARDAGIGQKTVNNLFQEDVGGNPTLDTLTSVAAAVKTPVWLVTLPQLPVELFGQYPAPKTISPETYRVISLCGRLPEEGQRQLGDYAEFILALARQRQPLAPPAPQRIEESLPRTLAAFIQELIEHGEMEAVDEEAVRLSHELFRALRRRSKPSAGAARSRSASPVSN